MSRIKKAVSKILEGRSDASFSFDDLCFVLERAGFTRRSGKGSHRISFATAWTKSLTSNPKADRRNPIR